MLRLKITFSPENRGEIELFFKKELERQVKSSKALTKPLGRFTRWYIANQLKKYGVRAEEQTDAIRRLQEGYLFRAEIVDEETAIMEWRDHFLIDYEGYGGEILAKVLFPIYFGIFRLAGLAGMELIQTAQSSGLKKAIKDSLTMKKEVKERVKEAILAEETKRFSEIDAKVELEV